VDGQVIVDPHVAFDKARHLPLLVGSIEAFENEDVTPTGRAAIALAVSLPVWMCQCCADRVAQGLGIARLGGSDAVRQTPFFHAAPCRVA
jgi:hypothetical protein